MATANVKIQCSMCEEDIGTFLCRGCSKEFCQTHLTEHCLSVNEKLQRIKNEYNQSRETLSDRKNHPEKQPLIQEIDQWEKDSINKIKETAEECRTRVINYTKKIIHQIEMASDDPNEQTLLNDRMNKLSEIDLDPFSEKVKKLQEELNKLKTHVLIEQQPTSFINKMIVTIPFNKDTTWKKHGVTIAGDDGPGHKVIQLSSPYAISLDEDQTIYIADHKNNRIVKWKSNATEGLVVVGGDGQHNQNHQLNHPVDVIVDHETNSLIIADYDNTRVVRWYSQNPTHIETIIPDTHCSGLTMDNNGSLYVCDWKKHEVRRWRKGEKGEGTVVAGGNRAGSRLNQFNCPTFPFVHDDHSLYVSDYRNHRVMKWAKDASVGIVVAGGNDEGSSLRQLSRPQGVIVDPFGQIYVADCGNNRVMRWCEGAKEGIIVAGGNGEGKQANQLHTPMDLAFDHLGNLYVTDCDNHRIQKFEIE